MELRFRMVLVDPPKGEPKIAYLGVDADEADKAYDKAVANSENEAVRLYVYPQHARISRPQEMAAHIKRHQEEIDAAAEKDAKKKLEEAAAAVKTAEQNLVDAKAAHEAVAPTPATAPAPETNPAPEKPKK